MKHKRKEEADQQAGQERNGYFNILNELKSVKHLMTVNEIACLLGKSVFTIYRMVRQRQIPFLRISGGIMFDPSVIALWLTKKDPSLAVAARQLLAAA